ncbi:DUF4132 domain-containing protein [Massilia rubra]|uniref:DUF4132 domain-containing protein n=1 Tax=Massilia rubra TaxID=2607910 RepID=A0ABX0LQ76_9BURK|nr:DUF4132 domain-containing protein [Massilia rubra]NHZ36605.1 DUF4132 domain-containing protein [Massilia rubra]
MRVIPPSDSIAPWLAAGALADMPPELAAHALPSRRYPGPPFCATSRERWVLFLTRMRENCTLQAGGDCAHQPAVIDTIERLAKRRQLGTPETDAVLLAMEKINEKRRPASEGCPFLDVLVADKGLPYAFDIMLRAQRLCLEPAAGPDKNGYEVHANSDGARQPYGITDLALRAHLAHAPQQIWEQCVRMARDAAKELHASTRPLLAALLPDAPELANELALHLAPADVAAFARLFADYELLQPFVQIGRDTHLLDDGEEKLHALGCWYGEVVPTGSLLGLLEQGWRRGPMQDGGVLREIARDLGGGYAAVLGFEPGIPAGMPGENAQQTLCSVVIWRPGEAGMRNSAPLSSLDAAVVSELIGDMARVCA